MAQDAQFPFSNNWARQYQEVGGSSNKTSGSVIATMTQHSEDQNTSQTSSHPGSLRLRNLFPKKLAWDKLLISFHFKLPIILFYLFRGELLLNPSAPSKSKHCFILFSCSLKALSKFCYHVSVQHIQSLVPSVMKSFRV